MAIFKCKMCGGTLEVRENESVCVCDFCGTQQTIATTQDEALQGLFNHANILRMKSEFDKAESLYEKIIQTKPDEAEAYWGLILCRYGIEYVEDPKTFKRIPTCHRTSFDSVIADPDYKAALQYADLAQRAIYEAEAKEIDRLQKEILALSQKEDPYDVFICYKETDESGRRTPDSVIANDIYHQLTQEGFKAFYAAISLENKLGSAYEPCIFAALNSAKVMLVVGTKPEYFNAVWVKNEWSRYLKLMKTDRSRILIPCYRDMDAYELPEEFAHLQAQDMSKIGFINDVVRGIKKVLRKDAPPAQPAAAPVSANAAAAQPLIDRGYMALEDHEWTKADEFFEQALNLDAKNGDAYLGKFLAFVKHASLQSFLKERSSASYIDYHTEHSYKDAYRPNEGALRRMIEQFVVPGYLDENWMLLELAKFDVQYESQAGLLERYISDCRSDWASYKDLLRAKQYGRPEIGAQLDAFFESLNQALAKAKQADAEIVAKKKNEYQQFVRDFQIKAAQMCEDAKRDAAHDAELAAQREAEEKRRAAEERARIERETEEKYQAATALSAKANSLEAYNKAINAFQQIVGYKDSRTQIKTLQERCARMEAQMEKEKSKKKKVFTIICIAFAVVVVASIATSLIFINVVVPKQKMNRAMGLLESGDYEAAYVLLEEIGNSEVIASSKYDRAVALIDAKDYEAAYLLLDGLDYKDSISILNSIDKRILMSKAQVGSYVSYGSYEQDNNTSNGKEDIEWRILEKKDNKILVISKYALDCKQYNTLHKTVTWETCFLRKWLNDTFINAAFSSEEQNNIISATVSADKNPSYSTSPGKKTTDKIFLLSITEVIKYFASAGERMCAPTEYAIECGAYPSSSFYKDGNATCWWWLRSPGSDPDDATFVNGSGSIPEYGDDVNYRGIAVRPAMWIDLGT